MTKQCQREQGFRHDLIEPECQAEQQQGRGGEIGSADERKHQAEKGEEEQEEDNPIKTRRRPHVFAHHRPV